LLTLNHHQHENEWIKASTTIQGLADDIAKIITDERRRHMWDINTQHVQKRDDGSIAVSYIFTDTNGQLQTSLEVLKHTFSETFINGTTTFIIKETVNEGQETRFYELVPLHGKQSILKVTLYSQLSPRILRTRGRSLYRSLCSLRTYV
jgi:hypothetical protein